MQYELFYLVGQNNEERLDEIKKEVEQTIKDEGGIFGEMEVITKRKLSYEVKHQIRGTYIAKRFDMPEVDYWAEGSNEDKFSVLETITKKLNLNQNILRFIIVRADELPELKQKEEVKPKKEVIEKPRKEKIEKTKEVEKTEQDSIDKKLEEILNI